MRRAISVWIKWRLHGVVGVGRRMFKKNYRSINCFFSFPPLRKAEPRSLSYSKPRTASRCRYYAILLLLFFKDFNSLLYWTSFILHPCPFILYISCTRGVAAVRVASILVPSIDTLLKNYEMNFLFEDFMHVFFMLLYFFLPFIALCTLTQLAVTSASQHRLLLSFFLFSARRYSLHSFVLLTVCILSFSALYS